MHSFLALEDGIMKKLQLAFYQVGHVRKYFLVCIEISVKPWIWITLLIPCKLFTLIGEDFVEIRGGVGQSIIWEARPTSGVGPGGLLSLPCTLSS